MDSRPYLGKNAKYRVGTGLLANATAMARGPMNGSACDTQGALRSHLIAMAPMWPATPVMRNAPNLLRRRLQVEVKWSGHWQMVSVSSSFLHITQGTIKTGLRTAKQRPYVSAWVHMWERSEHTPRIRPSRQWWASIRRFTSWA